MPNAPPVCKATSQALFPSVPTTTLGVCKTISLRLPHRTLEFSWLISLRSTRQPSLSSYSSANTAGFYTSLTLHLWVPLPRKKPIPSLFQPRSALFILGNPGQAGKGLFPWGKEEGPAPWSREPPTVMPMSEVSRRPWVQVLSCSRLRCHWQQWSQGLEPS